MATPTVASLNNQIQAISKKRDAKNAEWRAEAHAIREQRDELAEAERAAAKVQAMSPIERQTLSLELAKLGGDA
jgi:F0F1-type ATP synthase membrane subunit b/b'